MYRQIADEVRRCVSIGVLKTDEPLPAVRQLAETLKVNANTVQHAYRTLERDGAVYVKRGLGTFVSPPGEDVRQEPAAGVARQIAERMLREGFRHGLLASDLIAALQEIAPGRKSVTFSGPTASRRERIRSRSFAVPGQRVGEIDDEQQRGRRRRVRAGPGLTVGRRHASSETTTSRGSGPGRPTVPHRSPPRRIPQLDRHAGGPGRPSGEC